MSASPDNLSVMLRQMEHDDLDAVEAIEREIYSHPWTRGNFSDSLAADYHCWVLEQDGQVAAYAVTMIAAGEAHLLNLSVAAPLQGRGLGGELLRFVEALASDSGAATLFLEVRESNIGARRLYQRHGFAELGRRKAYYPALRGREDAVTMAKGLE
jgi:ribosomal-protein-alanine N-acetyltransferase